LQQENEGAEKKKSFLFVEGEKKKRRKTALVFSSCRKKSQPKRFSTVKSLSSGKVRGKASLH